MSQERGSEVLRRLSINPKPIDGKHLEGVFRLIDGLEQEIKILGWWSRGNPAFFEALHGSAELSFKTVGQFVEGLCRDDNVAWNCRVFPKGIPWPDLAIVDFESQQVR